MNSTAAKTATTTTPIITKTHIIMCISYGEEKEQIESVDRKQAATTTTTTEEKKCPNGNLIR